MCYRNKTIGIVVPAYNEALLIADTLRSIPKYADRIYVVDDCSKDKTSEIVGELSKKDDRIIGVRHEVNKGVGAAIATGYKRLLEDGLDIAAVMAGDNQMDGKNLPSLLDPIIDGRADYTKGNRLMSAEFRTGMSKWRVLGNTILTFLTKMASGYWHLMDPQNGYAAISGNALERIDLDSLYPRYGYCNDILVKLNVYGFRVMDVVMPARYGKEKSKIKYGNYIPKVSLLLLKDFFWRLKVKYVWLSFHPLVLFYMLGFTLTPLGILGGLFSLYMKIILGDSLFIKGVLSLLLFIIGMQFLFFAMLFDMQASNGLVRDIRECNFANEHQISFFG
jgi:glycosyltransferase involved in cell wall biosynthesis